MQHARNIDIAPLSGAHAHAPASELAGVRVRVMTAADLFRRPVLAEGMFRDRARQFKLRLRWDALKLDDLGLEYDQYDRPDTCYLALEDAQGRHCASGRLLPTTGPTMLNDFFSEACGGPIHDPQAWEVTRLCVSPRLSKEGALARRAIPTLFLAGMEYGARFGVTSFLGIYFQTMRQVFVACGAGPEPLGSVVSDHEIIEAGAWHNTPETLRRLKRRAGPLAERPLEAV